MIDHHRDLSISTQCQLLSISRSGLYYEHKGESALNLTLMRLIDELYMKCPYYGSRQMARALMRQGYVVSRKRVRRLMKLMDIQAIYQPPRTSISNKEHKIYPYLLKGLAINKPNQVWCADITYILVKRGFLYLVCIMDWYSRNVLAWRLSNTMDSHFCVEAVEEAIMRYGAPDIFNTDQGSQFTSYGFTDYLKMNDIKISMDGKGRWMDNVFIERLWRSLKYECVYLNNFDNGIEARQKIEKWIYHYCHERPHSVFNGLSPNQVYYNESFDDGLNHHQSKKVA